MIAGSLNFTIGANPAELQRGVNNAMAALDRLKIKAADINKAFDDAAKRMAGPSAGQFKTAAKSISGSIGGIGLVASTFFGTDVSGVVYPAMLMAKEFKALSVTMKMAKITATEAAGGIGAATAIVVEWYAALETAKAKMRELATEKNTRATLDSIATRLQKQILELNALGKLSDKEAVQLQVRLALEGGTVEKLSAAIKEVQAKLRPVVGVTLNKDAMADLIGLTNELKARTKTGKDRAVAELDIEMSDMLGRLSALATKAGVSFERLQPVFDAYAKQRTTEVNQQFSPDKTTSLGGLGGRGYQPEVTSLERMGFVFNGRGGGLATDHAQRTADNTNRTVKELQKTNALLEKKGGDSFANTN